MSGKINKKGQQ